MKRILFVDDDANVLDGLKRMLRSQRHEWDMEFAAGGREALEILSRCPCDVIVADVRMPGMNGAELLAEVARRHPHMVRIILSGTEDRDLHMKVAVTAHQYLSKPCHGAGLRSMLNRAFALREKLARPGLRDFVTRVTALPSSPQAYDALVSALSFAEVPVQEVAAIVAKDMAMTAKVLQLVNSAFFGYGRHIANLTEAVAYLGVESMRALTFSAPVFSAHTSRVGSLFSIESLQRHGDAVARRALEIARSQNCSQQMLDDTLVAGLLHDVGKLVLASEFPREYDELFALDPASQDEQREAERSAFGATHAEIGSYLLWLWGLPDPVVEAVEFHHQPASGPPRCFCPLAAVHMADAVELGGFLDRNYLAELGIADLLPMPDEQLGEPLGAT